MKKTLGILSIALFLGACGQPQTKPNTNVVVPTTTTTVQPIDSARSQLERMLKDIAENSQAKPTEWLVELRSDPTEVSLGKVMQEQSSFKRSLSQMQSNGQLEDDVAVTHEYSKLFNGFAITATAEDALTLADNPEVLAVWPSIEVERPTVKYVETKPDMKYAVDITGASVMHDMGVTGKGVKVGVIDSGVDVDHPAFAGRIVSQYDFVGDKFGETRKPEPDEIADDCGGHGSHVAGIVGGNDAGTGFKGVAPEVQFGSYRVFACTGSSSSKIIMDAMERAYADGMQVINMSLGAALQWPEYPTARMASRLSKKGVTMIISAGNEGTRYGQFSLGAPSVAPEAISVAAVENTMAPFSSGTLTIDGTAKDALYMHASGSKDVTAGEIVSIGADLNADLTRDGCAPFPADFFAGKAALISRGTCAFTEKVKNAVDAGATAVIISNNAPGVGSIGGLKDVPVPVGMITKDDGDAIRAALAAGKEATFTYKAPEDTSDFAVPGAESITTFSSYGMTPDLNLKPEVAAPGGNIYSAAPLDQGPAYVVMGGTSMSAPHVAGAVALMLEANPNLTPTEIKTRLMNSSRPQHRFEKGDYSEHYDHVQLQGAGLIDLPATIFGNGELVALPNKLNLGATNISKMQHRRITVHNNSDREKTFSVRHQAALTVAGSVPKPKSEASFATVTLNGKNIDGDNATEITIPANSQKDILVTINAPEGASEYGQYGGWIIVTDYLNRATVPYAGFIGDYQKESIFNKDIVDHTGRVLFNGPVFTGSEKLVYAQQDPANQEVVLNNSNRANTWVFFGRPVTKLEASVTNLNTGESKVFQEGAHIGRAGSNVWDMSDDLKMLQTKPVIDIDWNAKCTARTEISAGYKCIPAKRLDENGNSIKYQVTIRALKPLGDETNPNHWEVYKSPVFTLHPDIDKVPTP